MLTALKNHYFPLRVKIIALFLFLLLPLIIVGSTIYQYGYHTIRREITDSSSAQLALYAGFFSDEITRIQFSCYRLASNPDINYLINAYPVMTDYERSQYILRTAQLLSTLQNSSQFLESAAIYIPSLNKTISVNDSEPGILFSEYFSRQGKPDEINSHLFLSKTNSVYIPTVLSVFLLKMRRNFSCLRSPFPTIPFLSFCATIPVFLIVAPYFLQEREVFVFPPARPFRKRILPKWLLLLSM